MVPISCSMWTMTEVVKQTTVQGNPANPVVNTSAVSTSSKVVVSKTQTIEYFIYFVFSVLEILLAFRLVLKFMGASTASGFVRLIYGVTGVFTLPFVGMFHQAVAPGLETVSILEPSTIVALIVYAILAWGIVMLVRVLSREPQPE